MCVEIANDYAIGVERSIKMYDLQIFCRPPSMLTKTSSRGSMSGSSQVGSPVEDRSAPPTAPLGSHGSVGSMGSIGSLGSVGSTAPLSSDVTATDHHQQVQRRDSQGIYSRTSICDI
jgi:hypothetical protein